MGFYESTRSKFSIFNNLYDFDFNIGTRKKLMLTTLETLGYQF